MKITLLCSGLEVARDGVGDYTRRLAGQLIREGHPSMVVALNDTYVSKVKVETQESEGASIPTVRLPSRLPLGKRMVRARNALETLNPDWVSLQFVPFGFHPKGLCFGLGTALASLNAKASWHIMFHELWLGLGENASLKHRLWGALQRFITLDLVQHIRPSVVHTQTNLYRAALIDQKIDTSILPLFSNIPFELGDGWTRSLAPLLSHELEKSQDRSTVYLVGIFGTVHPEWKAEEAIATVLPAVRRAGKKLVLVLIGKHGLTEKAIASLRSSIQDRAIVVCAGKQSCAEISKILQALDLGLATSPRRLIAKSGSVVAMLEHGLKILVTRESDGPGSSQFEPEVPLAQLLSPKQFTALKTLPERDTKPCDPPRVRSVVQQLLQTMNSISKNRSGL